MRLDFFELDFWLLDRLDDDFDAGRLLDDLLTELDLLGLLELVRLDLTDDFDRLLELERLDLTDDFDRLLELERLDLTDDFDRLLELDFDRLFTWGALELPRFTALPFLELEPERVLIVPRVDPVLPRVLVLIRDGAWARDFVDTRFLVIDFPPRVVTRVVLTALLPERVTLLRLATCVVAGERLRFLDVICSELVRLLNCLRDATSELPLLYAEVERCLYAVL